jgi:hypothetical protein
MKLIALRWESEPNRVVAVLTSFQVSRERNTLLLRKWILRSETYVQITKDGTPILHNNQQSDVSHRKLQLNRRQKGGPLRRRFERVRGLNSFWPR